MHLHVRQSSGGGHGPHGDIPDSIDLDDLEVVGHQDVSVNYPDERNNEQVARLCPYCKQPFTGIQGIMIHLGQKGGSGVHPEDGPEKIEKEDCPVAKVDEDRNVIEVIEEGTLMPSTKRRRSGVIDREKVIDFIEALEDRDIDDEIIELAEEMML